MDLIQLLENRLKLANEIQANKTEKKVKQLQDQLKALGV